MSHTTIQPDALPRASRPNATVWRALTRAIEQGRAHLIWYDTRRRNDYCAQVTTSFGELVIALNRLGYSAERGFFARDLEPEMAGMEGDEGEWESGRQLRRERRERRRAHSDWL